MSSYSACHDQILLFFPLTTFVWFGCTCRPPLDSSASPSLAPEKEKLFYLLACHGALSCHGVGVFSLYPSWHAPNGSSLNLASFGWSVIPAGCTSQKSLDRSRKIGIFPSPPHQTIPPYLWPMTPPRPILARYRLMVRGPHTCFPFMYVQNLPVAHAFAAARRLACTVCHPSLSFYVGCFIILLSPEGLGFLWYWALHFFQPISWLSSCLAILLCHFYCNDLILLPLFEPAVVPFSASV